MERLTVWKLVIVPPSQRLFTKNMLARWASSRTMPWAAFLVPTKSTGEPWDTTPVTNRLASMRQRAVFCRSMMWIPFLEP